MNQLHSALLDIRVIPQAIRRKEAVSRHYLSMVQDCTIYVLECLLLKLAV